MALNTGYFYGRISEQPRLYTRGGVPKKAVLYVSTLSRYRNSPSKTQVVYDVITVMTENEEMIDYIRSNLKLGDMIHIKGMICTSDVRRKCICSNCEEEFRDLGYTCYIHPIHICLDESEVSPERGNVLTANNMEISNEIIVDAHVCTSVNYSEEYHTASYKVAVKRPFFILEDPADKKVDYPAVNTYFEQAESDSKYVHIGTRMNIKGSVRVRDIEKKITCPFCGNVEPRRINVLEIVASHIGYIGDWKKPDVEDDGEKDYNPEVILNLDVPD